MTKRKLSPFELHQRKERWVTTLAVVAIVLAFAAGIWFGLIPYLEGLRREAESKFGMVDLYSPEASYVVKREVTGQFSYQDFAALGVRYWVVEADDDHHLLVLTIPGQVQTEVGAIVKVSTRYVHCKIQAASESRGCDYTVVTESQAPR